MLIGGGLLSILKRQGLRGGLLSGGGRFTFQTTCIYTSLSMKIHGHHSEW